MNKYEDNYNWDLELLYKLLKVILYDKYSDSELYDLPLFSFEGLPGAGKTTQIKRVSEVYFKRFGKSFFIDLPSQNRIGNILKVLYSDQDKWNQLRKEVPWLNPLFLSLDLSLMLQKAKKEGAYYTLMSRGILSTYYYNLDAFEKDGLKLQEVWNNLSIILKGFAKPKAILFLDIPIEEARRRVLKRNRRPLRKMDEVKTMVKDNAMLREYIKMLYSSIPVHYINANQSEEAVTRDIGNILAQYLGK
ncbi:Thymidylate kinase-like domain-containing protein [Desulfonema limicola]|uniref:Thymidylate kinase-like domain-containing protein n=1 Tax=Desulfonema limicola TaxID=45656 RepID=A0A975GG31_9BACT|nr:deoxynucleoside kinase [Desulfonema limicola]QTA79814.1 Thymidylate kinase-like domain-containing protein [Desulfonema limicola]